MGCGSVTAQEIAERRVLIKRALRLALVQWADGVDLYGPNDEEIGSVEARLGERVEVICADDKSFFFKIEVV
jgi:hypothetical protein